jgi:hypothetical protein
MSIRGTAPSEPRARLGLVQRRPSAKERAESERALQRFVRLEHWNGFSAGDVVRVAGHSARGRHWRFRAHVTNTSNGASWVEVALVDGPAPSRRPTAPAEAADGAAAADVERAARIERVRSFDPDLLSPRWGRLGSRRRGSATAPRSAGGDYRLDLHHPQPEARPSRNGAEQPFAADDSGR